MGNIMQKRVNLCRLTALVLFSGTITTVPLGAANATTASCVWKFSARGS